MTSPTIDRRFGLVGNTAFKAPVTVLAASNITLSGQQTIDGVAVVETNSAGVPDRVLCIGQTDSTTNGIWDVGIGTWTRSRDANGNYDLAKGTNVLVTGGSTYSGTFWQISAANPITIGTTAMTWTRSLANSASTVSFLQAGTGAVTRTAQDKMREIVSVKDYGAVIDGSTDDSTAVNAALTYVKANGGIAWIPAGTTRCKNLRMESGTVAWELRGSGKELTTIKHTDGDGTLLIGNAGSTVPYILSDFTVDCQFAETAHASANNAISFADTSGVVVRRVRVQNYKNNGILGYASVANTYGDCVGEDCHAIGNGATTNNGLIFAEMPRCKWIDCRAEDIGGSPGYGIQLKNDCRWGQIINGYADTCTAGLAFGTDTVGLGAQNCVVQGFQSIGCTVGAVLAEAKQCKVDNLLIDMSSAGESAIDIAANSVGCSVRATVRNVAAVKNAAKFRSAATDNYVHIESLDNINTTGNAATFDDGALRNSVYVERVTNPTSQANGPRDWVTFVTAANNNSFEMRPIPYNDALTIAAGVVVMKNAIPSQQLTIDTEAAAVTDDLDTITNNYAVDGQTIVVRSSNDARDVVVKHGTGNILLVGAADFTLGTRRCYIELRWNINNSKWMETYKATHV